LTFPCRCLSRVALRRGRGRSEGHRLSRTETASWERLLGEAAGDEQLFERERRDAQARAKLSELQDERRVAALTRQPLLAEPGSVQLPRILFRWLVGDEARETGAITLADIGVLYGVLASFANDEGSLFPGARFEGDADDRTLILPGGIGSDLRTHGQTAGTPHDPGGSGHVRLRPALTVLALNEWLTVEQPVGELRIRLGERAQPEWEPSTTGGWARSPIADESSAKLEKRQACRSAGSMPALLLRRGGKAVRKAAYILS
jgi:hypothetical protein